MTRYQIIVKNKKEFEEMEGVSKTNYLSTTETLKGCGYLYTFEATFETFLKLRHMAEDKSSNIVYICSPSPVGPL